VSGSGGVVDKAARDPVEEGMAASGLRVVRVEGDATARGGRAGEALGDLVARSLTFYRDYLGDRSADLEPFRRAAERALPEHVAWLDAFAAGAGVSAAELFAVNALEELEQLDQLAPVERCSTFTAEAEGCTLLGHNEMWLEGDRENVALLVERPAGGPAVASPTIACCLPAVGLNAHRLAFGVDSVTARDDGVGVPRVFVSRHVLEAADRDDAHRRASLPGRAGGYAYVVAAPGEAFTIETTAARAATLDGPAPHTNHYVAPELQDVGEEGSASSTARYAHLSRLLAERPPRTPEDAMAILRDHACEPAPDGDFAILFSMVCEVESGRMWVAPGDPAETEYEEVDLAGVV
jgi:Acyl-coenzyme A:6-aminopenicillanic acid acyl-transferase